MPDEEYEEYEEHALQGRKNGEAAFILAAIGYIAWSQIPQPGMEGQRHTAGGLLLPALFMAYETYRGNPHRSMSDITQGTTIANLFFLLIRYLAGSGNEVIAIECISIAYQLKRNIMSSDQRNVSNLGQRGSQIGQDTTASILNTLGRFAGVLSSPTQPVGNAIIGGTLASSAKTLYDLYRGEDFTEVMVRSFVSQVPANVMFALIYGLTESLPLAFYASAMMGLLIAQFAKENTQSESAAATSLSQ